ncbi:hypothetical protein [Nitrobacter sp. TKz-YC02]|uniref:hypothetical protein n=1 Tax=Nitrobacter sp. TKz-YC02 TaxID=3398704 RepID=UPI003CEF8D42
MKRLLSANPPAKGITGGSGQKRERMANPSGESMRGVSQSSAKKRRRWGHAPVSIRLKYSSNLEIVIGDSPIEPIQFSEPGIMEEIPPRQF